MNANKCKVCTNKCKDTLNAIAFSKCFDNFIFWCIIINTLCMAATWYNEPPSYKKIMNYVNYFFAFVYMLEAILLITVMGKNYFKDGWKNFDFFIVITALLSFIVEMFSKFKVG